MVGKQEKQRNKKCPLCGGKMHEGYTTAPFFIGEKIIVIKGVPAEICSDCSESFLKSFVAGSVEKLLDRLEDVNSEISVVRYQAA